MFLTKTIIITKLTKIERKKITKVYFAIKKSNNSTIIEVINKYLLLIFLNLALNNLSKIALLYIKTYKYKKTLCVFLEEELYILLQNTNSKKNSNCWKFLLQIIRLLFILLDCAFSCLFSCQLLFRANLSLESALLNKKINIKEKSSEIFLLRKFLFLNQYFSSIFFNRIIFLVINYFFLYIILSITSYFFLQLSIYFL